MIASTSPANIAARTCTPRLAWPVAGSRAIFRSQCRASSTPRRQQHQNHQRHGNLPIRQPLPIQMHVIDAVGQQARHDHVARPQETPCPPRRNTGMGPARPPPPQPRPGAKRGRHRRSNPHHLQEYRAPAPSNRKSIHKSKRLVVIDATARVTTIKCRPHVTARNHRPGIRACELSPCRNVAADIVMAFNCGVSNGQIQALRFANAVRGSAFRRSVQKTGTLSRTTSLGAMLLRPQTKAAPSAHIASDYQPPLLPNPSPQKHARQTARS